MVDNKFLSKLSKNLLEILDDEDYYDVTIEVGDDPYVKIFRGHMVILNYRSTYFRRILSTNKKKNNENLVHIKLPNILPGIFQIILRYLYGGRLSLEEYDTSDIVKILITANELSLHELIYHLQSFLIKNKADWIEQNFSLIYQTSFENDSFLELQKFCTELMSKEPEKIFNSPDFTSISEKFLVSLIQHDNLQMSEVQVWEYVIKWGIAQNPELPSDSTTYSKDDFNILKNTLQQYIPFIKFRNLTSNEFSDKVIPYKKILPKELYKELLKYFLDSDNRPKSRTKSIDSNIITVQHVELISKWIDRLEITDNVKNSYEFKLILRGSRDGFSPKTFHEVCNDQSHTVTIIKVKDSNEILGGYNPIEWKSGRSWSKTKDSFIFSLNNGDRIKDCILSRVKNETSGIFNLPLCGPSFGNGDLTLYGDEFYNKSNCGKVSYEIPIRESTAVFSVEEYEIFQVIKD